MIRLVIFDLDGPILDSYKRGWEGIAIGARKLIKEKKVSPKKVVINQKKLIKCWGYPGLKTTKQMFPLLTSNELKVIGDCWSKNEKKSKIPLIPGSIKTLRLLKRKSIYCALLTSRSHNLQFHLNDYPMENLFGIVQSYKNLKGKMEKIHHNHIFCTHHKPNPKAFNSILKWAAKKHISKKEMVMIDDTLVGLRAAKGTNIKFLGVCTGPLNTRAKWLRYGNLGGKYVINSIADLPKWLKTNAWACSSVG